MVKWLACATFVFVFIVQHLECDQVTSNFRIYFFLSNSNLLYSNDFTMSNNIEIQNVENTNEWINWIEEAIAKEYFKYYESKHFSNIQKIGTGRFGKVYRANWKNLKQYLALKSFFNLDDVT